MSGDTDFVDGWEIHARPDGGYGVYDSHGLVAGPYGRKEDAIAAALRLPKPAEWQAKPNKTPTIVDAFAPRPPAGRD